MLPENYHYNITCRHFSFSVWDQTQSGRFNWLWHDVTTFEPYSEETSYENSLLVQQSGSLALSSLIHVFKSLTANAKGVFMLIANYQLEHSKEASYNGKIKHPELIFTKTFFSREVTTLKTKNTLKDFGALNVLEILMLCFSSNFRTILYL